MEKAEGTGRTAGATVATLDVPARAAREERCL